MKHKNYYQVKAKNNYDLGLQLGEIFKKDCEESLNKQAKDNDWGRRVDKAKAFLEITQHYFPEYINELKGYAKGADADLNELWALSMEDDIDVDKCTTIVTNRGLLLAHNEDWDVEAQNAISILEKTIGNLTIFELYYHNTLGGSSISINSYGYCQGINSLMHAGSQIGIPRNVIARFMSETNNPERDFTRLKDLPRQLGYSHVLVNSKGEIWNIETTVKEAVLVKPTLPFVHTNHFLTDLKCFDTDDGIGTHERYKIARAKIKAEMSKDKLEEIMSDTSRGKKISIFNEKTIGRMIVDLKERIVRIWIKREQERGWVDYELISHN